MLRPEETEVSDASYADIFWRDALHGSWCIDKETMNRFGIAGGHKLIIGKRQRDNRGAYGRILGPDAFAFHADRILRIQAPAPPLFHHPLREVAYFTQPLAGKVAEHGHRKRYYHIPQPPDTVLQVRRVLAPVATAGGDGHHLRDSVAIGHER